MYTVLWHTCSKIYDQIASVPTVVQAKRMSPQHYCTSVMPQLLFCCANIVDACIHVRHSRAMVSNTARHTVPSTFVVTVLVLCVCLSLYLVLVQMHSHVKCSIPCVWLILCMCMPMLAFLLLVIAILAVYNTYFMQYWNNQRGLFILVSLPYLQKKCIILVKL